MNINGILHLLDRPMTCMFSAIDVSHTTGITQSEADSESETSGRPYLIICIHMCCICNCRPIPPVKEQCVYGSLYSLQEAMTVTQNVCCAWHRMGRSDVEYVWTFSRRAWL